jgi:hypothetical protein
MRAISFTPWPFYRGVKNSGIHLIGGLLGSRTVWILWESNPNSLIFKPTILVIQSSSFWSASTPLARSSFLRLPESYSSGSILCSCSGRASTDNRYAYSFHFCQYLPISWATRFLSLQLSQSQIYILTDSLCLSCSRAPFEAHNQILVTTLSLWGALPDERTVLSFVRVIVFSIMSAVIMYNIFACHTCY